MIPGIWYLFFFLKNVLRPSRDVGLCQRAAECHVFGHVVCIYMQNRPIVAESVDKGLNIPIRIGTRSIKGEDRIFFHPAFGSKIEREWHRKIFYKVNQKYNSKEQATLSFHFLFASTPISTSAWINMATKKQNETEKAATKHKAIIPPLLIRSTLAVL